MIPAQNADKLVAVSGSADKRILFIEIDFIKSSWIPPFVSEFRGQFILFVSGFHCLLVGSPANFLSVT